jgi:2-dehydro-3-deoxyphosphogluconate aldolase / (4S)-4-hydroxy-2-oxoglutarate aldolase
MGCHRGRIVNRAELPGPFREQKVIAVARGLTTGSAWELAKALSDGGLSILEVTVEGEGAIDALASLRGSGMVVGAGTVTSIGQAAAALEAGASFLVSPHHDPSLTGWAAGWGVPFIPGGLTPTEIHAAWTSGAPAVKLFPASIGGSEGVAAIRGPFPDIDLIPTGGITAENAKAYLDAGAFCVGVGGWLTGHSDLDVVIERAGAVVAAVGPV